MHHVSFVCLSTPATGSLRSQDLTPSPGRVSALAIGGQEPQYFHLIWTSSNSSYIMVPNYSLFPLDRMVSIPFIIHLISGIHSILAGPSDGLYKILYKWGADGRFTSHRICRLNCRDRARLRTQPRGWSCLVDSKSRTRRLPPALNIRCTAMVAAPLSAAAGRELKRDRIL
jgi:hypothetical protein